MKYAPGNIWMNLKGNRIFAISGIDVNVFSKIKAPILSLFLDLKKIYIYQFILQSNVSFRMRRRSLGKMIRHRLLFQEPIPHRWIIQQKNIIFIGVIFIID